MLTKIDGAAMDAETVQMLSIIDEEKDANIIISNEGLVQFANKGVTNVRPESLLHVLAACSLLSVLTHCLSLCTACPHLECGCVCLPHGCLTHPVCQSLRVTVGFWVEQG